MPIGVRLVQVGVGGFDRELAAARHGVPRVDRQVQQGIFELINVRRDSPQACRENSLDRDAFAERAVEKTGQSAGHIKIYSEAGEGTTVKLYLPRFAGDSVDVAEVIGAQPTTGEAQSETILVVEDNELLLSSVAAMLRDQGYRVLTAANGATALQVLGSEPEVHLLFTDVGLPGGLNGRQLGDEVKRLRPDLKILFTTGYTRNAIIHQGRLDRDIEWIGKPFTYAALVAKIQRVLGQAG